MGEVITTFRVMPEGLEVDLGELRKGVEKKVGKLVKVHSMSEQPIAFGLKALMVVAIIPEKEGMLEKVESALQGLRGVSQVDTVDARRAL